MTGPGRARWLLAQHWLTQSSSPGGVTAVSTQCAGPGGSLSSAQRSHILPASALARLRRAGESFYWGAVSIGRVRDQSQWHQAGAKLVLEWGKICAKSCPCLNCENDCFCWLKHWSILSPPSVSWSELIHLGSRGYKSRYTTFVGTPQGPHGSEMRIETNILWKRNPKAHIKFLSSWTTLIRSRMF